MGKSDMLQGIIFVVVVAAAAVCNEWKMSTNERVWLWSCVKCKDGPSNEEMGYHL